MDGFPHNIYLTDFGLAEKMGGTPVFASPECFDESKQKSDIFSLGRVYLFIILSKSNFFLWLYLPIDKKLKSKIDPIINAEPILKLISNMTKMNHRFNIRSVRRNFDLIRNNSLLNLDKSLQTSVNNILRGEIGSELIDEFKINYIDGLHNLS